KTQLQGLQAQKSAEVGAVMQNLSQNLSQNSFNNLQSYIATRVKPKIKIIKTNNSAGTTQLRSEMSDLWIVPPDDLGLIHAEEGSVTFKL
ncbi:hypothetical protein OFD18_31835, partial [Escherichia coli]|nr:hypothetical protein [Escherichia coli]